MGCSVQSLNNKDTIEQAVLNFDASQLQSKQSLNNKDTG